MRKCKTANKGSANLQKGASPFPLSEEGEEGNLVWEPIEEIAFGGGAFTPRCFPKMPFRLGELVNHHQRGWCPLSFDETGSPTPEDRRHCCIQVRVTPGDRGDDQPPLSHAWEGCLITNILQEAWPEDQITEAVVLSPEEAILFFGRYSRNEGLPYCRAGNIEFDLGGPFNWAGRPIQIEASRKTVQEG